MYRRSFKLHSSLNGTLVRQSLKVNESNAHFPLKSLMYVLKLMYA
jgi:hypothetical protein